MFWKEIINEDLPLIVIVLLVILAILIQMIRYTLCDTYDCLLI